jgi:autoinducer-2 kinase
VPPGAGGLVAVLSNTMNVRRWVHAAPTFVQFDLEHPESSGRKECVRAIMESAAFVLSEHLARLEQLGGGRFDELVLAGGATRGNLWPQIVADVAGIELRMPPVSEATLRGGALMAALGSGSIAGLAAAARAREPDRRLTPDPEAHRLYRALAERRRAIYDAQLKLAEQGLTEPLWWAPGAE